VRAGVVLSHALALAFGGISAACGVTFPDASLIQDLRVLEIRAEPPEISVFQPAHAIGSAAELGFLKPNFTPVEFSAIVAHPDLDATFEYTWIRCTPGFQRSPCDQSGQVPVRLQASTSSTFQASPIEIEFLDVASMSTMTGTAGGARSASLFSALETFVQDPRDLLNGFYANINLDAAVLSASSTIPVDTHDLEATKRVVVFDPQIVRVSIQEAQRTAATNMLPMIAGYNLPNLCTTATGDQLQLIFAFLAERTPNRTPRFRSIEFARRIYGVEGATRAVGLGEVLEVSPGEDLVFRGRVDEADKEAYAIIDDNCQLVPLHEVMSWSWFASEGAISKHLTTESAVPEDNERHRTVYTAPSTAQLTLNVTRARIWSVLRDGRGGSTARSIDLVIVK
jgi:hypothetical protein